MPSKEAPVSLRLPETLRNRVADYAAKHELAYHRALVVLIEAGLGAGAKPLDAEKTPERGQLEAATKPRGAASKPARGKKKPADDDAIRRTGATAFCEHRVPIGNFCSRCAGMH